MKKMIIALSLMLSSFPVFAVNPIVNWDFSEYYSCEAGKRPTLPRLCNDVPGWQKTGGSAASYTGGGRLVLKTHFLPESDYTAVSQYPGRFVATPGAHSLSWLAYSTGVNQSLVNISSYNAKGAQIFTASYWVPAYTKYRNQRAAFVFPNGTVSALVRFISVEPGTLYANTVIFE